MAMGDVTCISALIPGSEVTVSGRIVCVKMLGDEKYYDALTIEEIPSKSIKNREFSPLVSVPSNAKRPVVLIKCDMCFEGDFTPRALGFVKQGAHYVTTMQSGLKLSKDEEVDLICDMGYVLSESSNGAVLLGILSADME